MKKKLSLFLSAALLVTGLTACGGGANKETERTSEEWNALYAEAITNSRPAEENEYFPFVSAEEPEMYEMTLTTMGLTAEDMEAHAISISLMNVSAYAIAAIRPVEGREETVTAALQTYVDNTRSSFEFYLPGPFEVASNARLETLEDGTILLVMCEGQDAVFEAVSSHILGK